MTQGNTNTANAAAATPQPDATNMGMLGEVVWLMAHSKLHSGWPMTSIFQWVVPALVHKQCRLYRRDGRPVAYVAWAYMSKEVEEAYVLNPRSLSPKDWTSGERGWILDWIAPFGDTALVMKDLREGLFKDAVGRALRVRPGSDEMQIIYIHGANAFAKARDRALNPPVDLKGASLRAEARVQARSAAAV